MGGFFLGFRAHLPLVLFCSLYFIASIAFTTASLKSSADDWLSIFFLLAIFFAMMLIPKSIGVFLEMIFRSKPQRPLKHWLTELKNFATGSICAYYSPPLLLSFFLFAPAFANFKGNIANHGFYYDTALYYLDLQLHFGHLPAKFLHELPYQAILAKITDKNYHLWFFVMTYSFFLACFGHKQQEFGLRFFIASLLVWVIGGNLIATIFSSAGPCYYGLVSYIGTDPYATIMDNLKNISKTQFELGALKAQNILWENHQSNNPKPALGISAFPSMHVTSSFLLVFATFSYKQTIKWAILAFALLILLGSIYLGWHYAIDSYTGIFLSYAAWKISKPITRNYINRPSFQKLQNKLA